METLMSLLPLILLVVIMWFLLIRPQKKKEKQINAMRNSLKVGDKVLTIGGIYGKIVKVKDDRVTVEVGADRVKFDFARWGVSQVLNADGSSPGVVKKERPVEEEEEDDRPKKLPKKMVKKEMPTEKPKAMAEEAEAISDDVVDVLDDAANEEK